MYRLEKVARAPQTPAAWVYGGTAFHHATEYYEKGWCTAEEAEAEYLRYYDEEIANAKEREPATGRWLTGGRTRGDVDIANRRERGKIQVRTYIQWLNSQKIR